MTILFLNEDYIKRCNDISMTGKRGNGIQNEAESQFARFDKIFEANPDLTDKQLMMLDQRKEGFLQLVTESYNIILKMDSEFVSPIVAGPSNYDNKRAKKQIDRLFKFREEVDGKIDRYLDNTIKRIEDLEPLEVTIENYKKGKWAHGETVSTDDPHVIEKLEAKLYYRRELQDKMKAQNKNARKEKATPPHPPWKLQNNNQSIKSIERRISLIKSRKEREYKEIEQDGYQIVPDKEANRVRIYFDDKPDADVRSQLKSRGFRWAPSVGAWQRALTDNAMEAAKSALGVQ